MNDTTSAAPSKAEIEALAQQHLKAFAQFTLGGVWFEGEVEFARAVLAKWGTPQPSPVGPPAPRVEPVAWLNPWRADQVTTDYDAYGRRGIPLYTAPQPVAQEPLTDEQLAEMMRDTWGCASIAPRHAPEFARAVERAHGIAQKGGG